MFTIIVQLLKKQYLQLHINLQKCNLQESKCLKIDFHSHFN